LALVVFGAIECPPSFKIMANNKNKKKIKKKNRFYVKNYSQILFIQKDLKI